jgi:glycosyltransferase involved in cell wall biosynthesis
LKIAIIHDWLVTYAGAERVLEQIIIMFPEADLFSMVDFLPGDQRGFLKNIPVTTSFIQKLPQAKKYYRQYLPFMPLAVEQFDLSNYDLIISCSHAVAKGVITGPDQLHISYVHSPIRYAWDLQHQYLKETNLTSGLKGSLAKIILHYMRIWDLRTSNSVDHFIANSEFIARRIDKIYRREATVIYPPVDIESFTLHNSKEDFYLTASRMVPYKKVDLIVEAFNEMPDKKLVVIGDGPDQQKIKAKAKKNIEFLGFQPSNILKYYMQRAQAFIFAAEEDFGITPVEAQACGTPVIAYAKGGATETIKGLNSNSPTGVFFSEQKVRSLQEAVKLFEQQKENIKGEYCRRNAERFSISEFNKSFSIFVNEKFNKKYN